jgi:hypothetical protein
MSDTVQQQLVLSLKQVRDLKAMLEDCLEYFEDRSDVLDGPDGIMEANREMSMAIAIKETLGIY